MYIRRKVFSLGEGNIDYDYNIYQQLYSEAFDEGFEYAIEKLYSFAEEKKLLDQLKGMGYSGKRLDNYLRDWKNERRYVADRFKRGDKGSLEFQKLKLSSGKTLKDDPIYEKYTRLDGSGDPTKIKKAITDDILSDAKYTKRIYG